MEEYLLPIYEEAQIYSALKRIAEYCSMNRTDEMYNSWNALADKLGKLCQSYAAADRNAAQRLICSFEKIKTNIADASFCFSVINGEVLPQLLAYYKKYEDICVEEGKWHIESSSTGYLGLKNLSTGKWINSEFDPMDEAGVLAKYIYNTKNDCFFILGCDLGYLAYNIWLLSEKSAKINIYESDTELITYGHMFGVLDMIPKDQLNIITGDDDYIITEFLEAVSKNNENDTNGMYIFPWKREEYADRYSEKLENYALWLDANRKYHDKFEINLRNNKKKAVGYIDKFDSTKYKNEWVVVAAGPSLEENLDFLRESQGIRTIIAVNTVIRRMKKEGIKADLICVADPNEAIMSHIVGYEDYTEGIPCLAEAQAYWGFVEKYRGPVYLVAGNVPNKTVRDDAQKLGLDLWENGGTVTSMAYEAACRMGAEKVYIIGMDLSFPGGVNYAGDMPHKQAKNVQGSNTARSNDGGPVSTGKVYLYFKGQVEGQIARYSHVKTINLSKHGIYVKGTAIGGWWEKGTEQIALDSGWPQLITKDDFLNWKEKYYLLRKLEHCAEISISDDDMGMVLSACYENGKKEMGDFADIKHVFGGLNIIIITSCNFKNAEGQKVYEAVKNAVRDRNKKYLIINSRELFGGESVTMWESDPDKNKIFDNECKTDADINENCEKNESINIDGRRIPYYQMPCGMPDAAYYREIITFLQNEGVEKVISTDRYSLFAYICNRLIH